MTTIQIIASSRYTIQSRVNTAKRKIKNIGFVPFVSNSITKKDGFFAGSIKRRASEINSAFANRKVDVIFEMTGGYGCIDILDLLDFRAISKTKKPFVGYSDVTIILLALHKLAGIPAIHGPMLLSKSFFADKKTTKQLLLALRGGKYDYDLKHYNWFRRNNFSGRLIGGNLSLVVSTLGTKYEIETQDKVFFIEEVNEKPRAIYNMLHHLRHAGKFDNIKGLLVGKMVGCGKYKTYLRRFFKTIECPILWSLDIGHTKRMFPLPLGRLAKITKTKISIV